MTAAAWESLGVVAATVLTGIGLLYTVAARPKIRAFQVKLHEYVDGLPQPRGSLVYVANLGRAPAIIQSAGLRSGSDNVECSEDVPSFVASQVIPGRAHMVLKPGDMVAFYTTRTPGLGEQFGAFERRAWAQTWAYQRLPRKVRARLRRSATKKWHHAVSANDGAVEVVN